MRGTNEADAFEEAVRLRDAGRFDEALVTLAVLQNASDPTTRGVGWGEAGAILFFDLGRVDEAIEALTKSVALAPRAELPSLYLFHALWKVGRVDDAFDEARRLLRQRPSDEYRRLMREITATDD